LNTILTVVKQIPMESGDFNGQAAVITKSICFVLLFNKILWNHY